MAKRVVKKVPAEKTIPPSAPPKRVRTWLWLAVLLQLIAIGALGWMLFRSTAAASPTSAIRASLDGPHAAKDARLIAAFYGELANLVEADNARTVPAFVDAQLLIDVLSRAGHHAVGPDWSINDRYPRFVDEAAKCLESVGMPESGELDSATRSAIGAALRLIAQECDP